MYKLTSIITDRTYLYLEHNKMLPTEQKSCKHGSYGCKDQLPINKMKLEDCHTRKKHFSTTWIDYRKAYDSVPHSWIIKVMEIYKVSPILTNMKENMRQWRTTMILSHTTGTLMSRQIKIISGIFQSPLLFCLSLAPLSGMLNNTKCGYEVQVQKVSHLPYMDDLKT